MLPVRTGPSPSSQTNMYPGARRSFFCRMKFKSVSRVKDESDHAPSYTQKRQKSHASDRKYCVIHCIGYLKSWISNKMNEESEAESDIYNMSCLVAIGRILPNFTYPTPFKQDILLKPMNFTFRHTIDGKFLFVDQRATLILGYLPQELLGSCCYEYCHPEDLKILAESHRLGLQSNGDLKAESRKYRFKTKSGSYVYLKTSWKTFKNPWTKEFEFLVAVNSCVFDRDVPESSSDSIKGGIRSSIHSSSNKWAQEESQSSSTVDFSTVDEILFRIKDFCPNKVPKASAHNGNGEASSTEQTSTGYSSTDTKSVQKMLATSRVALWKIGRYIADEVLENQRRNEEPVCVSNSLYSSSPTNNEVANFNVEMIDPTSKWKSNPKEMDPLISSDSLLTVNEIWSNSNLPPLIVHPADSINSVDGNCIAVDNALPSQPNENNVCIMMGSSNENNGKNSELFQQQSDYDALMISANSCDEDGDKNSQNSGGAIYYRQTWSETKENTSEEVPMDEGHQAQFNQMNSSVDQENEDAAMDLIMSILEADGSLGDPVNPEKAPCPWI